MPEKIAIIGGGIAGLTAGYLLNDKYDVTLFEKDKRLGGNVYTLDTKTGEEIFDPFFTTKPKAGEAPPGSPEGTGLGLHSCLDIVKTYNGRLDVSTVVGNGATFTVYLPLGPA